MSLGTKNSRGLVFVLECNESPNLCSHPPSGTDVRAHRTTISTCWADRTDAPGSGLPGFQYPADDLGQYWVGRTPFFDMCPVHRGYSNGGCTDPTKRSP